MAFNQIKKVNLSKELYTRAELSQLFDVTERCIDKWIRKYNVPVIKIGASVTIPRQSVEDLINEHMVVLKG